MKEIISATIAELEPLAEMFDLYRQFYRQQSDISGAQKFLAERISNNDSVIFLAKQPSDYTGFVQCYPLFSSVGMKKLWLLNDLFVKSDYRGKGISKLLIDRCKQLAKDTGAKGLMLETEKSNTIGNQLYPKEGFVLNEGSNFYEWRR
ncbi:MAG: GNAT family N-acetyltransferase [Bacteroidetes bacterium]|nr:GNAT family N-acetyltransferase [Bacteroidota bacterium]